MALPNSVLGELEDVLESGTPQQRTETLRKVTSLFLDQADRLNDEQIGLFDDVLMHLIKRVEDKALVQLSNTISGVVNAPLDVVRNLARHAEISVAGPVLTASERLTEADLIQIAQSTGQEHLLAISGRQTLTAPLTDALLVRGQQAVTRALAQNNGAQFSQSGMATLVKRSETDAALAESVGLRLDLPLNLLRQLLAKATDIVRTKLLAMASPEQRAALQKALAEIANEVAAESKPREYKKAEGRVQALNREGRLNEMAMMEFAVENRQEEIVAALSLFCGISLQVAEKLVQGANADGLIIACKAAKLTWPTVAAIMKARAPHRPVTDDELAIAKKSFLTLSEASAQRTIRFMKVQEAVKSSA